MGLINACNMGKVLLIHGSTVGLEYSFFKQKDLKYGYFKGVKDLIDSGNVDLFLWADRQDIAKTWEFHKILKMYHQERVDINESKHSQRLYEKLKNGEYTTVITHSMGGELLTKMIQDCGLPKNLENIYTLQSDAPAKCKIKDDKLKIRLDENSLNWCNYHCFWDIALLTSLIVNQRFSAGLTGYKTDLEIINLFYPLHGSLDLHTSIISIPKEIRKICLNHI
jgi:hypothetical protein